MDQLKEQVYRVAAQAANDAVAAVARYEGTETNSWSMLPLGEQDVLWKEARTLHTGEKDIEAKPRLESKEFQELRTAVTKLALTYLTRTKKEEKASPTPGTPVTGSPSPAKTSTGGSGPTPTAGEPRVGGPIRESDFQKEADKK